MAGERCSELERRPEQVLEGWVAPIRSLFCIQSTVGSHCRTAERNDTIEFLKNLVWVWYRESMWVGQERETRNDGGPWQGAASKGGERQTRLSFTMSVGYIELLMGGEEGEGVSALLIGMHLLWFLGFRSMDSSPVARSGKAHPWAQMLRVR